MPFSLLQFFAIKRNSQVRSGAHNATGPKRITLLYRIIDLRSYAVNARGQELVLNFRGDLRQNIGYVHLVGHTQSPVSFEVLLTSNKNSLQNPVGSHSRRSDVQFYEARDGIQCTPVQSTNRVSFWHIIEHHCEGGIADCRSESNDEILVNFSLETRSDEFHLAQTACAKPVDKPLHRKIVLIGPVAHS
ncbi:hypothetical protein PMAYCL1PPCAC_22097, partial [Pristionchus mayeri]